MSDRTAQRMTGGLASQGGDAHPILRLVNAVQSAEKLRLAGKLDQARSTCAAVLKQDPDYVAALSTMGLVLADASKYEDAVGYLHRAAMLNPSDPKVLTGLSGVYLMLGAGMMAARTLEQARETAPNDANILITLGEIYRDEKEYELSKEAFEAALAAEPARDVAQMGLAQNLMAIGQLAEAAEFYERKIREGSRALSCFYNLGQVPPSMVSIDLVSLLEEVKPKPNESAADFRSQLAFSKAAALDKAGRFEEAWTQACAARRHNAAEAGQMYKKQKGRHATLLELARTAELNGQLDGATPSGYPLSLFIVGPSRSGKTSLERLAGSVPGVKRGYENPIVENAVRRVFKTAGFPTRSLLVQLPPVFSEMFQQFYLEELAKRAGTAKVLTNTLPQRTEDALRAAMEIPNARFVFVKRDIDDLTIRIFMRNYAKGNYYASELHNIRDYLEWCHEIIDTAAARMPEVCRVMNYEDMVVDPAGARRDVTELCGLEISDAPLPSIGDDRGCALPYREYMQAEFST